MLDLHAISDEEITPAQWWAIGLKEYKSKPRARQCDHRVIYDDNTRFCTRNEDHRGPHISGANQNYRNLHPPLMMRGDQITKIDFEGLKGFLYDSPELY